MTTSLPTVETPIVCQEANPRVAGIDRGGLSGVVCERGGHKALDRAVAPLEVAFIPIEQLGQLQDPALVPVPPLVAQEHSRVVLQLRIQLRRDIRLGAQRRASDGSAVDGEVDTRLVELLPDDPVFDVVKMTLFPEQGEETLLPRS